MQPLYWTYEGKTKNGRSFQLRPPHPEDLDAMWQYVNALSKEKTHVRFQGEEVSLEQERAYLDGLLKAIQEKNGISLLAFSKDRLIGVSDVKMGDLTERHQGIFSISIAKDWRGEGLGSILMRQTIEEAIRHIPCLEIVVLGLFARNLAGLHLYKQYGFKEFGRLPQGAKLTDRYDDRIIMYKAVR